MSLLDLEPHIDFAYQSGGVEFKTGYGVSDSLPLELFIRVNFPKELYPVLLPKAVELNHTHKEIRVYPDKEHSFLVKIILENNDTLLNQVEEYQNSKEKMVNLVEIIVRELSFSLGIKEEPVLNSY